MGMTDAQIKALQPRAARYLVSDGRGLSLDVLPSGVKSWMYRYRCDGKPQKITLPVEAPEWIKETELWKLAMQGGTLTEYGQKSCAV